MDASPKQWASVTSDGAGGVLETVTGVNFAGDAAFLMVIECDGSPEQVIFTINGTTVSHATDLPALSQNLGYGVRVVTLTNTNKEVRWKRIGWDLLV